MSAYCSWMCGAVDLFVKSIVIINICVHIYFIYINICVYIYCICKYMSADLKFHCNI